MVLVMNMYDYVVVPIQTNTFFKTDYIMCRADEILHINNYCTITRCRV